MKPRVKKKQFLFVLTWALGYTGRVQPRRFIYFLGMVISTWAFFCPLPSSGQINQNKQIRLRNETIVTQTARKEALTGTPATNGRF